MANLSELIKSRILDQAKQPSESEFAQTLSQKIQEKTEASQPLIQQIERERAEIPAMRAELQKELQNVHDPFARRALIERRVAAKKGSIAGLERGLAARQGRLENVIEQATQGFRSAAAREAAITDAMMKLRSMEMQEEEMAFSQSMQRARLALSQKASARAERAESREEETSFETVRRMARERGGDIEIYPDSGGLKLSFGGVGTPLNEFVQKTGMDARDVLSVSLSASDAQKLNELEGQFGSSSRVGGDQEGSLQELLARARQQQGG